MIYKKRSKSISTLFIITLILLFTQISCNQVKNEPVQAQQIPVLPPKPVQPGSANGEPLKNPPHGQPNHRCDIPVGAPLNSPPASTNKQAVNNAEVMLNPPHGQPNHRCDIPVGAPLNSPPESTSNQAAGNQVQTTTPQISTAVPDPANNPYAPTIENAKRLNSSPMRTRSTANYGSKPRLNPPHGQPFHRCDIPVGSPLSNTP